VLAAPTTRANQPPSYAVYEGGQAVCQRITASSHCGMRASSRCCASSMVPAAIFLHPQISFYSLLRPLIIYFPNRWDIPTFAFVISTNRPGGLPHQVEISSGRHSQFRSRQRRRDACCVTGRPCCLPVNMQSSATTHSVFRDRESFFGIVARHIRKIAPIYTNASLLAITRSIGACPCSRDSPVC
jgi:hypothetical protein